MMAIGEVLSGLTWLQPISQCEKTCDKHGVAYTETVYKHHTVGCPLCRQERQEAELAVEQAASEAASKRAAQQMAVERLGASGIPPRFAGKMVRNYQIDPANPQQMSNVAVIKAYAHDFLTGKHNGRSLALLGNSGTGKTHLACALANHVIQNCAGTARFMTVSELDRLVRYSKGFKAAHNEQQMIDALAAVDLLILDEVGVQSGTEAESRALFDVFNARYQAMRPTVLIGNLSPDDFVVAVGNRVADRIREDGGEILLFDWGSYRGQT